MCVFFLDCLMVLILRGVGADDSIERSVMFSLYRWQYDPGVQMEFIKKYIILERPASLRSLNKEDKGPSFCTADPNLHPRRTLKSKGISRARNPIIKLFKRVNSIDIDFSIVHQRSHKAKSSISENGKEI